METRSIDRVLVDLSTLAGSMSATSTECEKRIAAKEDSAEASLDAACDAFNWLWEEGETVPRMLSVGLHLRMTGRPRRIGALRRILEHMSRRGEPG